MKKLTLPALAVATALTLAGCGEGTPSSTDSGADNGSESPDAAAGDGELTEVTVGTLPILPTAVIELGIDEGFFEDEGLELQVETGQGGAALLPAVMSGSMDFATGNPISLLQARDQGLDVRVVSSYTYDTPEGVHAVLALADSDITSAKDLEGKTVAVNTLKSMGDLTIMEAVAQDGGDPEAVTFVEMPYPNMEQALDRGDVDAVWTPEPFMTIIGSGIGKVVTYPGVESVEGHPTMMFFSSGEFIDGEAETVQKMSTAINAAMDFASENPDAVRAKAIEMLDLDPALAEKVVLEDFGGPVRRDVVQAFGDLMDKYGILENPADVEGLLQSVPQD
ncbi:ABC transporter substrate-binding protein [Ornithinimicrobium sp. LYQ103]|uniref:ABC transporter substrate-binding protein n=1 Tax=Ornithinimicrobium sp. LYQ103 TaxID=3378796 RepID=UPI003853DB55